VVALSRGHGGRRLPPSESGRPGGQRIEVVLQRPREEEGNVKLLEEIPSFPEGARKILEGDYGIDSAEAFYVHALKDPRGLLSALHLTQPALDKLVRLVEGYLSPDYIDRCRQPTVKNPRGVILD
jgi:hypothetical protein